MTHVPGNLIALTLSINGKEVGVRVDPRRSLLDLLRDQLGMTGTKKGCDHGQCGACTVHVDGERRLACLQFSAQLHGRSVLTIEGVADDDGGPHELQKAFVRHDAMQCGFCTPGQIMSALDLINKGCPTDRDQVRESLSGNLCRCGAYDKIVDAVLEAAHGFR